MNLSLEELLKMRPEQLASVQHTELKNDTIRILKEIIALLQEESYSKIKAYTEFSPAGDCMGCDNHFIKFANGDIMEVVERLICLKEMME